MKQMIYKFTAIEAYTDEEENLLIAGVASDRDPPQYLTFQRTFPFGGDEDWGIHIEFEDQINSGYRKVQACSLRRGTLRVDLVEPIDWEKKYSGIEIRLQVGDTEWKSLATALGRIFTGFETLLDVEG